jgi:hypothetical protein
MTESKSPGVVATLGASQNDQLGGEVFSEVTPHGKLTQAIRAELIGKTCAASRHTAYGQSSVVGLCRALVGAHHDPRRPLHAYRDNTLVLAIRSVGKGSRLTVDKSTCEAAP